MYSYYTELTSKLTDFPKELYGSPAELNVIAKNCKGKKVYDKIKLWRHNLKGDLNETEYIYPVLRIPTRHLKMSIPFHQIDFSDLPKMEFLETLECKFECLRKNSKDLKKIFNNVISSVKYSAPNLKTVMFDINSCTKVS